MRHELLWPSGLDVMQLFGLHAERLHVFKGAQAKLLRQPYAAELEQLL